MTSLPEKWQEQPWVDPLTTLAKPSERRQLLGSGHHPSGGADVDALARASTGRRGRLEVGGWKQEESEPHALWA